MKKELSRKLSVNYFSTSYLTNEPVSDLIEIKFIYQLVQLLNFIKIKSVEGAFKQVWIND